MSSDRNEKTRLFIAVPSDGEPELPPSHEQEQTRFLPVELVLEQQRRESAQLDGPRQPVTVAPVPEHDRSRASQPASNDLEDTDDLQRRFAGATWAGRARRAWRSLSIVSRISVVLAALAALLVLLPRVLPAALESGGALTRAALARAEPRSGAAPDAMPDAAPDAPPVATPSAELPAPPSAMVPAAAAAVSPRAAADAVAQGRCAAAVALYVELFRQHPEVEAYREAARILKRQYAGCTESE